ncbi:S1C family serine protease [Cupriavidus agavae]|uniref:Trypsin-like peptidase n=1 Tax=Cupriavidus agavae TaxID=1001822 RepID=A0A4Q7RHN2_9BURK|nr:trypsin-like peptidase domain-containing protein [Cupriavidus agavae]RZT31382.1 trypsin-like peptidase [Cupriavidus agavae]
MKRKTIYGCVAAVIVLVVAGGFLATSMAPPARRALTQADIDKAVLHTLQTRTLPSRPARAAEAVRESVVEVMSYSPKDKPAKVAKAAPIPDVKPDGSPGDSSRKRAHTYPQHKPSPKAAPGPSKKAAPTPAPAPAPAPREESAQADPHKEGGGERDEAGHIGSGVVVTESGMIITSYHVVADAHRIEVRFHNGQTAEATLAQAIPEKDLAILRPRSIPDDLPAAVLGSSQDLAPGSEVVAVGFPFGIGPSISAGVVSGLDREFVSPDRRQKLDRLIQFDAAANPGNSGGPLVNMDGEVVGIVTAILNPNQSGTFIGIGFAITIESAGAAIGSSPF